MFSMLALLLFEQAGETIYKLLRLDLNTRTFQELSYVLMLFSVMF